MRRSLHYDADRAGLMHYRLFHEFAHRFDLHTPDNHYQNDHEFVLGLAKKYASPRLLDVACGTGGLLREARAEGIDATGLDASPEMIAAAVDHLGPGVVRVQRMEELTDEAAYDVVSCLSWSLNYLADQEAVLDVLRRLHRALRPGGTLILQVAHAANATGEVYEDREAGPGDVAGDVIMLYRFTMDAVDSSVLRAQYVYACLSEHELVCEEHVLHVGDAPGVVRLTAEAGFVDSNLYESWRCDPFEHSVAPLIIGRRN